MPRQDGKRNFVWLDMEAVEEAGQFTGRYPRQAALKAARRLDPAPSEEEARESPREIVIRERGESDVHVYEGWAWTEPKPEDGPDWLGDTVTKANVSKLGVEGPGYYWHFASDRILERGLST